MKNNLRWFIFFLVSFIACSSYCLDYVKCSRMLNNGLYKTYRWQGINNRGPDMTAETKKNGSSHAYSDISTENSTADLDPKYTSNFLSSMAGGTFSSGDCSLLALSERKNQRDLYITQNFAQVRKEIAEGHGPHVETLAYMSLCDEDAQTEFDMTLQSSFEELYSSKASNVGTAIDKIINSAPGLNQKCFNLSSI